MKVFAVNLASQTEKKVHILNECTKHGIEVEVIQAVYGKDLSKAQVHAQVYDYPSCSLTRGEIGCALSHLTIYQRMIDEQLPLALILEDDAMLDDNTGRVLHAIEALETNGQQPHVYLLSPSNYYLESLKKKLTEQCHMHKIVDAYYTHAYVLNLEAAKALASFLKPIKYEADKWGYFQQMGVVNIHCIVPAPAITNDQGKASSDIENERLQIRNTRSIYFRRLRKQEMPLLKKIQRLFLKILISLRLVKVVRKKV